VIVRVFTGRVVARREGDFNANVRARLDQIRNQPGNVYVKFARKIEGDREVVMLITEWRTAADLYAWTAGEVDMPHMAQIALFADQLLDSLADTELDLAASRTKLGCPN